MINMFQDCADAGLKSYAPYTVNPRCYDVYNVENNAKDMRSSTSFTQCSGTSTGCTLSSVRRT